MKKNTLHWIVDAATLTYIAEEVTKLNPVNENGSCIFCDYKSEHDSRCAWLRAKEFTDGTQS